MDKDQVAEVLVSIATLLELKGENPFKCRAYQNAARTIEALMVLEDAFSQREGEVNVFDDLVSHPGVVFDEGKFHGAEAARLAQNLGGNGDLADIVQAPQDSHGFDPFHRKPHFPGNGRG